MNATAVALALLLPAAEPQQPVDVSACVAKGLKWLAEQQKEDGNWVGRADSQPTMTTSMAGLALLMEGSTLKHGKYAPNLRKAVEWLEKNAQPSGLLATKHPTEVAQPTTTHAYALLFLACVYDVDDDAVRHKRLGKLLTEAVDYAETTQSGRGGWGNNVRAGRADDPLTTVTMLQGLMAARKAGIDVPGKLIDKAIGYTVTALTDGPNLDLLVADSSDVPPRTLSGATAALFMFDGRRPAAFVRWLGNLSTTGVRPWPARASTASMSTQFHMARVAYALGENGHRQFDPDARAENLLKWSAYRETVFRSIKAAQSADGSWVETVPGPVFGSAVALVILQMENDYLSAFSR
jgi:hypothetical protein